MQSCHIVNEPSPGTTPPHKRRKRYSGRHPRRFEDKYKEHGGDPETIAKVMDSGKTPSGTHRPIMVAEVLQALAPKPGETAVDCTLGHGGHAEKILAQILPGGKLIGLDVDPVELPKTEARLRGLGFQQDALSVHRSNFAGLPQILAAENVPGADVILADLGVSSMQIDNPARGFSVKFEGPLDMRMNPQRGQPASAWLEKITPDALTEMLVSFSDEPRAAQLGPALAGNKFASTRELADAIGAVLPQLDDEELSLTIRRVFQAVRIAVNDELAALDAFLRNLPLCLNAGGRVAVLTFHSGEDRRVKKSFEANFSNGIYADIAREVTRPTPEEQRANRRSAPAKLRWAVKAA